jgi:hypothetical protein
MLIAIGVFGAILSTGNAYYNFFRGPDTKLSFSPSIYFIGSDLIGIGCTFSNRGSRQDTINFMTAEVEGESKTLRPVFVAVGTHQWLLQKDRKEKETREPEFTNFTAISIAAGGSDSRVVWFTSDDTYRFEARDYKLIIKGYGSDLQDVRTQSSLEFSISKDGKANLDAERDIEISMRNKAWILPPGPQ